MFYVSFQFFPVSLYPRGGEQAEQKSGRSQVLCPDFNLKHGRLKGNTADEMMLANDVEQTVQRTQKRKREAKGENPKKGSSNSNRGRRSREKKGLELKAT
jgi:hypothetical protein